MSKEPKPFVPEQQEVEDAGRYFRYMSEFVGFTAEDGEAIRRSGLIVEKHLPAIIGRFYTNLLQHPPTRKFFLKPDGTVDEDYLQLRMYHQANFWRRAASGGYDDDFAHFVDYVGRAHTSRGADVRLYIDERYVIGMVGFVQHAIIDALQRELNEYDPDLEKAAVKAWNKLCMVILEMLARAYGHDRGTEEYAQLLVVDPQEIHDISVNAYEKGLGMRRRFEFKQVAVARVDEIPDGERKIVNIDGLSIGVFHHKGEWYAIRNQCLHRGGPVAAGRLVDDNVVCPWHGYTYNITDGRLLIDPTAKLETYPVSIIDDQVLLRVPAHIEEGDLTPDAVSPDARFVAPDAAGSSAESPAPEAPEAAAAPAPGGQSASELQPNEFRIADLRPGQIGLVTVNGMDVAVYNVAGAFYATANECTHADGPLNEGDLDGATVTCPWHYSCFDVTTGAATCPPARDPLKTYRVTIDGAIGRVEE